MGRTPRRIVPRINMSWTPRPNSRHSVLMQSWKFNHSRFALGWRRGNRAYLVSSTEDCTAHPVIASLCDNLSCRDRLDKRRGKSGPLCPICQSFVSFFFFFSLFSAIFPPNSPPILASIVIKKVFFFYAESTITECAETSMKISRT